MEKLLNDIEFEKSNSPRNMAVNVYAFCPKYSEYIFGLLSDYYIVQ